jgi:hypothetical protein
MRYPSFFDAVAPIVMRDPLAEFLGAVEGGLIEYRYVDAVKLAGHSCPTVASAWTLTRRALASLYGDAVPQRGDVRIEMRGDRAAGVTGVMANIAALLTGASSETGFKGIAGRFDRRELLFYAVELPLEMRFTRVDTGDAVDAGANLQRIPSDPEVMPLLQRCAAGCATDAEAARFGALWQDRVRRILLDHPDDDDVFVVRSVRSVDESSYAVSKQRTAGMPA